MDRLDVWGGAPEVLVAGGANNAVLHSGTVTIYPIDAFNNAYTDASAYADALAAVAAAAAAGAGGNMNHLGGISAGGMHGSAGGVGMGNGIGAFKGVDVEGDAKYLRAKVQEMVVVSRDVLGKDILELEEIVQHRGE